MNLYWEERKKIIQELKGFNIPLHVIGAIPETNQAILLGRLKNENPYDLENMVQKIINTYQDR